MSLERGAAMQFNGAGTNFREFGEGLASWTDETTVGHGPVEITPDLQASVDAMFARTDKVAFDALRTVFDAAGCHGIQQGKEG